jgi:hypothetical protein
MKPDKLVIPWTSQLRAYLWATSYHWLRVRWAVRPERAASSHDNGGFLHRGRTEPQLDVVSTRARRSTDACLNSNWGKR